MLKKRKKKEERNACDLLKAKEKNKFQEKSERKKNKKI